METRNPMRRTAKFIISLISLAIASSFPARAEEDLWGGVRHFAGELSADNQVVFTESNATGSVDIVFNIATKSMKWEITFDGLTSPATAISLHGPAQPGTNGEPLIDLAQGDLTSPIRGSGPVSAAQVQYLLLGWTYVSIATKKYPNGEIRGKIDVVPPPNYKRFSPESATQATQ